MTSLLHRPAVTGPGSVLVTGASGGVGQDVSRAFGSDGWHVGLLHVLVNPGKAGLFSVVERMELLRDAVAELPIVRVDSFEGLLVDYCKSHDIPVIVKGLRAVSDFEYELQMAQMNRELAGIETLFVPTAPQVGHLSSSLIKQIATFGGDVSRLVPKAVHDRLLQLRSQGEPS